MMLTLIDSAASGSAAACGEYIKINKELMSEASGPGL